MDNEKTVSAITIYPVKACKGISLQSVAMSPKGPLMDRRWMVVDAGGHFVTQRRIPKMCLIETELLPGRLLLRAKNHPPFILKLDGDKEMRQVTIFKDTLMAKDEGKEVSEWLSDVLHEEVRLVFLPDDIHRPVNPKYAVSEKDEVSFADGYPVLIISEASLGDLNLRLKTAVPMNRFRPNLVISGSTPYEEDTWKKIRIGSIIFECVKPCSRCTVTTVNQATGEVSDEPLQTLATYRKQENKIMFGQNCIHCGEGVISVGNKIEVLEFR